MQIAIVAREPHPQTRCICHLDQTAGEALVSPGYLDQYSLRCQCDWRNTHLRLQQPECPFLSQLIPITGFQKRSWGTAQLSLSAQRWFRSLTCWQVQNHHHLFSAQTWDSLRVRTQLCRLLYQEKFPGDSSFPLRLIVALVCNMRSSRPGLLRRRRD